MRVMVAMSGGVDSSVAAALVRDAGHEAVGVTLRLWGGDSDSGCCSVSDVEEARWAANALGIDHLVFNFADEFDEHVVAPYVADHFAGLTPNPCIECNRHLKFDRLLERARTLGFDAVATGHHAQIAGAPGGRYLARGADPAKDQSYVLYTVGVAELDRVMLPIGHLHKAKVREMAAALGLAVANKPDSQDVCFVTSTEGRAGFLGKRGDLTPAIIQDVDGRTVGSVPGIELVTIGQRKGIGAAGGAARRFVIDIDRTANVVTVGPPERLLRTEASMHTLCWNDPAIAALADSVIGPSGASDVEPGLRVLAQPSAHGNAVAATVTSVDRADRTATIVWDEPQRPVSPGQSVVFYDLSDRFVLGGGIVG